MESLSMCDKIGMPIANCKIYIRNFVDGLVQ